MYPILLQKINDSSIINLFGKIAGFGGLALGVYFIIIRKILTINAKGIFPNLTQNQAYRIIMTIILSVFILSGYIIYIYFGHSVSKMAIEVKADGTPFQYTYIPGGKGIGNVYDLYRTYDRLNDEFDVDIKNKIFSSELCKEFTDLINSSKDEYDKTNALANNKPINCLLFLQGTLIGGSNLRLALLYEIHTPDTSQIIKFSEIAKNSIDTAFFHLDKAQGELSIPSKTDFDLWLSQEDHVDRYIFTKFIAESLLYRYDTNTFINYSELSNLYKKVNKSFIRSHYSFSDSTSYPIIAWLKGNGIITNL